MVAASSAGPGGFSYAQAAKSRPIASTQAKSHTASDAQSSSNPPLPSSTKLAETEPSKDWADDVDASEKEQVVHPSYGTNGDLKTADVKSSYPVERTKLDSKLQSSASGIPSPDLATSATSHDDVSSAQNGSSQTSWEAKSQVSDAVAASEPAWIAERKERQSVSQKQDDTTTNGDHSSTEPAQKLPVLHDAPPPAVNPWAKRAEVAKAKIVAQPVAKSVSEPVNTVTRGPSKENQKPTTTAAKPPANATSTAQVVRSAAPIRPSEPARPSTARHVDNTKQAQPRSVQASATTSTPAFNASSTQDSVSWPTPENSQDAERKSPVDNKAQDDNTEDGQANKPRKKQEWKPVPVVPNIIWQTPGVRDRAPRGAPSGEKPSRGGSNARGRGGLRGGANTSGDRTNSASKPSESTSESASRETSRPAGRSTAPTSARQARASSVSSRKGQGRTPSLSAKAGMTNGTTPTENTTASAEPQTPANDAANNVLENITDDAVPKPIPRHPSAALTNGVLENANTPNDAIISANGALEPRKESAKEHSWTAPTRGLRRGRGRGGNREVVNGHTFQHANGSPGEPAIFNQYSGHMPAMHMSRGNASFNQYNRGGSRSSGYRTQSLPMEAYYGYGRMPNAYVPQSPLLGMPTFQHGMPDMYSYPMSPSAYSPSLDQSNLAAIGHQVDYYFSVDNLLKDMYLRKNMDGQGFVLLDTVAAFKRVMELTQDREVLKAACQFSEIVEIRIGDDGKERLRPVREPSRWVLEEAERVEAARHDGPKSHEPIHRAPGAFTFHPSQVPPRGPTAPPFPGMPFRPADRRSYDYTAYLSATSPHAMFSPEFAGAPFPGEQLNGDDGFRDRQHKASARELNSQDSHVLSPTANGTVEYDLDVFPNERIEQLTVCVKLSKDGIPPFSTSSRTFSHGSIDADLITLSSERGDAKEQSSSKQTDKTSDATADSKSEQKEPTNGHSAQDVSVFWIKDNDKPVSMLPSDLTPEPYVQLRHKALEQRSHAATGTCPYDLDVLYQFWSHFLIRNFNNSMYADFKHFAGQDAAQRNSPIGHRNLAKYYDQALNNANQIPLHVAKDYLSFVKAEVQASKDDRPALKALHRSWRDGALNLRNRKRVSDLLDAELRKLLED